MKFVSGSDIITNSSTEIFIFRWTPKFKKYRGKELADLSDPYSLGEWDRYELYASLDYLWSGKHDTKYGSPHPGHQKFKEFFDSLTSDSPEIKNLFGVFQEKFMGNDDYEWVLPEPIEEWTDPKFLISEVFKTRCLFSCRYPSFGLEILGGYSGFLKTFEPFWKGFIEDYAVGTWEDNNNFEPGWLKEPGDDLNFIERC